MGGRCAAECAETDACPACKEDAQSISLQITFDQAEVVVLQRHSHLVQKMTGNWYNKKNGRHMGEIIDEYLYWNFAFGIQPSLLQNELANVVETEVNGKGYFGTVSLEAQASITWSDGSIWLRK